MTDWRATIHMIGCSDEFCNTSYEQVFALINLCSRICKIKFV